MNLEERRLITDLFDRMRAMGRVDKDPDAASLIAEELRRLPDAGYMLVQTVLVQDQALARADDEKLRELDRAPAAPPPTERRGFFGGASVPSTSPRSSVPLTRQSPTARDGEDQPGMPNQAARNGGGWGGGGFLGSALTTAAGVAGGLLLADSIRGLFNEPAAGAAKPTETAQHDAGNQATDNNANAREPEVQDASHHDDGGSDGWDFGEMDI